MVNGNGNEFWQVAKMMNEATEAGINADRLQDDRLGKQLRRLNETSERSHENAFHDLEMLLFRYGDSNLVPEGLYNEIIRDGHRMDNLVLELKVSKEFPEFDIVKDPVILQNQYRKTRKQWSANVSRALRAAKISTSSTNSMYAGIQMISAMRDGSKSNGDSLDDMLEDGI